MAHWSMAMRVGRLCAACALLVFEPSLAVAGTPDCDSVGSPIIYGAGGSSQTSRSDSMCLNALSSPAAVRNGPTSLFIVACSLAISAAGFTSFEVEIGV